jgi:hypothetical protein
MDDRERESKISLKGKSNFLAWMNWLEWIALLELESGCRWYHFSTNEKLEFSLPTIL